ncbi:MAG: thioredoxin-related protein [Maribacter sp.]|jgi:thioredoxin-related protein
MRKLLPFFIALGIIATACISYSFTTTNSETLEEASVEKPATIEWMSWDEAIAANEKEGKKIFIDVYTEWCGWCKKMDASTFRDKEVVKYMSDNFYAVKLDAEMEEDIIYKNHTFKFVKSGRRGYHELAASLLENKLSFPSFVAMDEKVDRITIIPGYMEAKDIMPVLKYISNNKYKTMTFEEYDKPKK